MRIFFMDEPFIGGETLLASMYYQCVGTLGGHCIIAGATTSGGCLGSSLRYYELETSPMATLRGCPGSPLKQWKPMVLVVTDGTAVEINYNVAVEPLL